MKRGYIRPTPAMSEADQAAALKRAGVPADVTWIEELTRRKMRTVEVIDLKARQEALRTLRRTDVLVVAALPILALSTSDFIETMRTITKIGAKLHDASTGEDIDWPPAADRAMAAVSRYDELRRQFQTANARAAREEARTRSGKKKGRLPILSEARKAEARIAWADLDRSATQVAEEFGMSVRGMYSMFGARTQMIVRRRKRMIPK